MNQLFTASQQTSPKAQCFAIIIIIAHKSTGPLGSSVVLGQMGLTPGGLAHKAAVSRWMWSAGFQDGLTYCVFWLAGYWHENDWVTRLLFSNKSVCIGQWNVVEVAVPHENPGWLMERANGAHCQFYHRPLVNAGHIQGDRWHLLMDKAAKLYYRAWIQRVKTCSHLCSFPW